MVIDLPDGVLSPREGRILAMLEPGQDVSIEDLYAQHLAAVEETTPRARQQHVGAVVAQMNKKLVDTGYRIAPGVARRTYRLTKQLDHAE